jgi:hypothetical protein
MILLKNTSLRSSLSTLSILFVAFVCLVIDFSLKHWEKQNRVIEHDVHSYYAYLPAKFIYDDLKIEKSDYRLDENYYLFWPTYTQDGKAVIKTTMGLSFLYAPFFFAAHGYALITDYPENGISEPYKLLLLFSSIFYLIIGLDFLRKTLRILSFNESHIAIVLLLIGLGTNLLCYSSQSGTMSHTYSFCLISLFIFYSIKWHHQANNKNTIILGLLLGLISIIRPTNIIIVLFLALYGVTNWAEFKARLNFFRRECFLLNVIAFFAFLVWVPQLIYWKETTGAYFFNPFVDERFYFDRPRILEGLFSFRKGWLLYTPMMAFAVLGICLPYNEIKKIRAGVILFLLLNIYIIFSWWCWWYGGSFGQRSMIDSYALLALPLAFMVRFISEKPFLKIPFYILAAFFIWLNIFQTYQYENLTLHWEGMTKELYFKQFGKMEKVPDYDTFISYPNFEDAKKGLRCDIPQPKKEVKYDYSGKREIARITIQLKTFEGLYVCADEGMLDTVFANKQKPDAWETFSLILFENNQCSIVSFKDKFWCAEGKNQTEVIANRDASGYWETFTIERLPDNYVAFKAFNNNYLSLDVKTKKLLARGTTIGENEKFLMVEKK